MCTCDSSYTMIHGLIDIDSESAIGDHNLLKSFNLIYCLVLHHDTYPPVCRSDHLSLALQLCFLAVLIAEVAR